MSQARLSRNRKQQLGQFLTPPEVAAAIVRNLAVSPSMRVLEPSFGDGSFIFALLDKLKKLMPHNKLIEWANINLHGVEIDQDVINTFTDKWNTRNLGPIPNTLQKNDFFKWLPPSCPKDSVFYKNTYFRYDLQYFDLIIGNPPFGGSIDPKIQDNLDAIFGIRYGMKIKKETYAFFLLKCLDLLKPEGRLCFICSDTLLTISTMKGLRNYLQETCDVCVSTVPGEFEETTQNMVLITLSKTNHTPSSIRIFNNKISKNFIKGTPNLSWRINEEYARYFSGVSLGDYMTASSGMTIGNNKLFLREIDKGNIVEPYEFSYAEEPITLAGEIKRARLGQLSDFKKRQIIEKESLGEKRRIVEYKTREGPLHISLPNKDYKYYNKSTKDILYSQPKWAIFWKDEGEYVYTYKKSRKWYLHGIGGKPYFGREGITWSLIASRMRTRWLPPGYILDSGAPCAFLNHGVQKDEIYFILGWTLTRSCNKILKNVINHTRNIQGKDFERLPYPVWVSLKKKSKSIKIVKQLVHESINGKQITYNHPEIIMLDGLYEYKNSFTRIFSKFSTNTKASFPNKINKSKPLQGSLI